MTMKYFHGLSEHSIGHDIYKSTSNLLGIPHFSFHWNWFVSPSTMNMQIVEIRMVEIQIAKAQMNMQKLLHCDDHQLHGQM